MTVRRLASAGAAAVVSAGQRRLMDGWTDTLRLALPLMAAQMATIALGLADTVAFGRLGVTALAGGGLAVAVFSFVHVICIGVLMAVGNQVAWLKGANQHDEIAGTVEAGLFVAVALGAAAALLMAVCGPLLTFLGQKPALVAAAVIYLGWVGIGIAPSLVFTTLRGLSVGLGYPGPIAAITALAVILKVVFNAVVVLTVADSATGLKWIGIGTAFTFTLMAGAMMVYCRLRFPAHFRLPGLRTWRRPVMRETLRLGVPIGAAFGIEAGLFTGVALIVGGLGPIALAAHHVANQWVYLTFMIAVGLSHATSVRVGQAAGGGDWREVRRVGGQGLVLGLAAMTGTAVLYATFGYQLAAWIVRPSSPADWAVIELAAGMLMVAAAFQWVDGLQNIAMGALRGLKEPGSAILAAVVGYWLIGLPAAWLLVGAVEPGAVGAWIGLALGLTAAAAIMLARLHWLTRPSFGGAETFQAGWRGLRHATADHAHRRP